MRLFEIIIPLLLSAYLLWPHPRPLIIRLLPSAAAIAGLLHLLIEGQRWQMIPLYVLTAILLASSLIKIQSAADWKPLASFLTLGLVAVSTALPILLPVPQIPSPSRPYSVGTRIYELTDESRPEMY